MSTNAIDSFINKKKANSPFITIEDGGTQRIRQLREVKMITKAGFGGDEKECLRLICDVDTPEGIKVKNFDNPTQRFAEEIQKNGIVVGSSFTIRREGQQTKTRYTIEDVVNPAGTPTAAAVAAEYAPAPAVQEEPPFEETPEATA